MDELKHFGIKGMRWGIRKKSTASRFTDDKSNKVHKVTKHGYDKAKFILKTTGKTLLAAALIYSGAKIAKSHILSKDPVLDAWSRTHDSRVALNPSNVSKRDRLYKTANYVESLLTISGGLAIGTIIGNDIRKFNKKKKK